MDNQLNQGNHWRLKTEEVTNTLYVGNLRWWVTDQDLYNLFSQFGVITALKIHADKVNGKSKGYAFIAYSLDHPMAGVHAREKLNGYMLEDNGQLLVSYADPQKIKLPEFTNTNYNQRQPMNIPMPFLPPINLPKMGEINPALQNP